MSNTMIMYSRLVIRALRFAAPHQLRDPGCYLKDPGVPERKVAWLAVPLAVHVSRKSPRSSKLVPYALTWLGVFGAILTLWTTTLFWRNGVRSRWSRVHHSLIAASSVMIAWFFLTFHIAGTTLTY